MSDKTLTPTAINLIKARDLIRDPADWCPEGEGINGQVFNAVTGKTRRCILQAINALDIVGEGHAEVCNAISAAAYPSSVIEVNRQGHAAAVALFNKAISNVL